MKKIETTQRQIITVKNPDIDSLTRREEYLWAEFTPMNVFDSDINGIEHKKLASYCCCHYGYDNYTVITDNHVLITLMIESGRISTDKQIFENLADLQESNVDNYHKLTS